MALVTTRFLVISDTHAGDWQPPAGLSSLAIDVLIHCGDLTEESKLADFRTSIALLASIPAPLKLAITGNHDFTLDTPTFARNLTKATPPPDPALVAREFGACYEAEQLFAAAGIHLLPEGRHRFTLANGAVSNLYASPYTPSLHPDSMGFQYHPTTTTEDAHTFAIDADIDVAITHGPPRGRLGGGGIAWRRVRRWSGGKERGSIRCL